MQHSKKREGMVREWHEVVVFFVDFGSVSSNIPAISVIIIFFNRKAKLGSSKSQSRMLAGRIFRINPISGNCSSFFSASFLSMIFPCQNHSQCPFVSLLVL
jgi:hypothetical protein